MRNAVLLTLGGTVILILLIFLAAYSAPEKTPQLAESSSSSSSSQISVQESSSWPYLLRAYEGKLAVFTDDLVQPEMVFDVYIKTLPEYDQKELERGIRVENYEKLTALIEDYIS